MHNVNLLLDGHDHSRLDYIGGGLGVHRIICHASVFPALVLPQLEVPMPEGAKQKRCVRLFDEEKEILKAIADKKKWTQISLVRALIFYYWKLRKSYDLSLPKMGHGDNYYSPLAWAPDRAQPWYSFHAESLDRMEERITADMSVFVRILRESKVKEEVIQKILNKFDYARQYREGYYVAGDTPAALQVEVEKAEMHRPGYFNVHGRKR